MEVIGLEQTKRLSKEQRYVILNTDSRELLDFIIANNFYLPNKENLCIITNYLNKDDDVNAGNLNLSRIKRTGNNAFILYIENNIDYCLEQFSDTVNDEEEDSLLYILNNENIDEEDKINYLTNQRNRIENIEDITESFRDMAVKLFLVKPTWENVASYFCSSEKSVSENLISYIEHYGDDLGYLECVDSVSYTHLTLPTILRV